MGEPLTSEQKALAKLIDLVNEVIYSHAHKNDKGGYFTDPHVYNECEATECAWCEDAKAAIKALLV